MKRAKKNHEEEQRKDDEKRWLATVLNKNISFELATMSFAQKDEFLLFDAHSGGVVLSSYTMRGNQSYLHFS